MPELRIRPAIFDDAEAIARVLVEAWRESYSALMPPEALASLDVGEQAARWREVFLGHGEDVFGAAFLVTGDGGEAFGFAACGRQRSPRLLEIGYPAEFSSLYLLRRAQRRGAGRGLMRLMAAHLADKGASAASVWAFRDHRDALSFYEALGGERTGVDGVWSVLGLTLPDVSYGWRNLAPLIDAHVQ
jgi:ribosomal protein S18 acetylase RimI-like enzyme